VSDLHPPPREGRFFSDVLLPPSHIFLSLSDSFFTFLTTFVPFDVHTSRHGTEFPGPPFFFVALPMRSPHYLSPPPVRVHHTPPVPPLFFFFAPCFSTSLSFGRESDPFFLAAVLRRTPLMVASPPSFSPPNKLIDCLFFPLFCPPFQRGFVFFPLRHYFLPLPFVPPQSRTRSP